MRSLVLLCGLLPLWGCGGEAFEDPGEGARGKADDKSKIATTTGPCPMVRTGRISDFDRFVDAANAYCDANETSYFSCEAEIKEYFEKCEGEPTLEGVAGGLAAVEGVDGTFEYDGELSGAELQSALAGMQMAGWLYALRAVMGDDDYQLARGVSVRPVSPYMEEIVELLILVYPAGSNVHLVRLTTIQEQNP